MSADDREFAEIVLRSFILDSALRFTGRSDLGAEDFTPSVEGEINELIELVLREPGYDITKTEAYRVWARGRQ